MRIAIVGKGGSGKSSLSWLMAEYSAAQGKNVLAIDADYNMDLAHNLGIDPLRDIPSDRLLKRSESDIYKIFGLQLHENAFMIPEKNPQEVFSLSPSDTFTQKYSHVIHPNLKLMVLGDHDNETLYSGRCSHAYAKGIKFYLPYLSLTKNDIVIIDSVAGTDMVNYGLYLGVDAIISVVEDTRNSVAVMESVKELAQKLNIPFFALRNKSTGKPPIHISASEPLIGEFGIDPAFITYSYHDITATHKDMCATILATLSSTIHPSSTIHRLTTWKKNHSAQGFE